MSSKPRREAFDMACYYLGMRDRTGYEIEKYLLSKGYEDAEIQKALIELKEHRYIDDLDYAKRYIDYLLEKGQGIRRIKLSLSQKGISPDDIEDAIYSYEEEKQIDFSNQREKAREVAIKALAGVSPTDKKIASIGRKLKTLGYGSDEIYYAIGELMKIKASETEEEF